MADGCWTTGAAWATSSAPEAQEREWADILAVNVDGTRAVCEAVRRAGMGRLLLASSVHAAGFLPTESPIVGMPAPRPDTHYGVGKAALDEVGASSRPDRASVASWGRAKERPIERLRAHPRLLRRDKPAVHHTYPRRLCRGPAPSGSCDGLGVSGSGGQGLLKELDDLRQHARCFVGDGRHDVEPHVQPSGLEG
ncbi:NAD-dependent epimerase/dehydratase family protein [Isoptericola sp. NPDC057191]|uniref:NAD-dependent epimerase/dehydratase family protein n=1 Tax=Isoptericola sp. NPDC057191 TaxID=3346041 RepID=UPI00362F9E7C